MIIGIDRTAKMVGDYNFMNTLLYTEKFAGNVTACMGFVNGGGYYFPNTVLKEDVRNITQFNIRVLATYKKSVKEPLYKEATYFAKGISKSMLTLTDEIKEKIDFT